MTTPVIPLNPGLVAIIGARGSGKTALADIIAAGCDSISDEAWSAEEWANPSFLIRARPLVGDGKVKVSWASGEPSIRALDGSNANGPFSYERVRYLSQQFVEELCSSSGLTDGLLREIERVIFEAHPDDARDGTLDFAELLDHRASRHRLAREREAEAVSQISERIGTELEKEKLIATYEGQVAQKKKLVDAYGRSCEARFGRQREACPASHRTGGSREPDSSEAAPVCRPAADLPGNAGRGEGPAAQPGS
jgi:hypothetical protein